MTNIQLYLAIGIPVVLNTIVTATMIGFMWFYVNKRLDLMEANLNLRFEHLTEMWRTELKRVEEVLDARLKHLEDK